VGGEYGREYSRHFTCIALFHRTRDNVMIVEVEGYLAFGALLCDTFYRTGEVSLEMGGVCDAFRELLSLI